MTRRFHRVAVLKGGRSAEREVSLVSGAQCAAGLRSSGYDVVEIDAGGDLAEQLSDLRPDAVFNALHGRWGEDGCVQGMLEWLGIPYTHSGVLASSLAMDKVQTKIAVARVGVPVAPDLLASPAEISGRHVMEPPYVVKPWNEGSSVGIHIVQQGANTPPQVDDPGAPPLLMVERYVAGRELTVAVRDGEPLGVTEIVTDGWYDYAAKYEVGGSHHIIPADVPAEIARRCLDASVEAHRALGCRGVTRSDFRFDEATGDFIFLELNTQPGMTPTSLVPEQALHCGVSFPELVAWIVEDASCDR